jgi:3-dehydroquinate synthase
VKPYRQVRHGEQTYPVYLGPGVLLQLEEIVNDLGHGSSAVFVTSPRVENLFRGRIRARFPIVMMPDGEQAKTIETADAIIGDLIRLGARRDALIIAVGGGVVGDTAGFAASVYLRGVDLMHVPTTLLAQVDSSIGGKVAVNHRLGKNLIGSFHAPRAVLSDTDVLKSLSERETRSGLFEALKAGVIGDPLLFEQAAMRGDLEEVVRRSVDVKADIVSADARESDRRRLLNYGHTVGHAIEAALNYEGVTHGDAIAWGMIGANALAVRRGILPQPAADAIHSAIREMMPDPLPQLDPAAVLAAIDKDKKFTASHRVMVLAKKIGECAIVDDVTESDLRYAIDAALAG